MILTRQQKLFRGNGSAPNARAIADGVITALSPAAWYRNATDVVSSGGFASIWADYASSDKGLVLPGVAGNFASMPDSAAIPLLDVDCKVRLSLGDWTPAATAHIVGQRPGNVSWELNLNSTSNLVIIAQGGGIGVSSTAALPFSDGDAGWVRFTRQESSGDIKFYYSTDATNDPSAVSWTQLGTTVSAATGSLGDIAGLFTIGAQGDAGGSAAFSGKVYRVALYSTIGGATPVFDADFSAQAIGTASFTESSSNAATVTINTSGASPAHIGKARDLLQGTGTNQPAYAAGVFTFDGADNYLKTSAIAALVQPLTIYAVLKQVSWTSDDSILDGNAADSCVFYQAGITPKIDTYAGSDGPEITTLAIGSFGIAALVMNGAASSARLNNASKVTANVGAGNPGAITVAARGNGAKFGHIELKELVYFLAAHSDADQDAVITALNNALTVF